MTKTVQVGYAILLTGLIITMSSLIVALPHIHQWERDNNFPYGKLCDLYRSCR